MAWIVINKPEGYTLSFSQLEKVKKTIRESSEVGRILGICEGNESK